jgi:uncharacterized membrane protein (DUF485 family)
MSDGAKDVRTLSEAAQAQLARLVLRRQAALSLSLAAIFLGLILGLPLLNHYAPQFANTPIFGFPLTWLFLGILFFPITWLLSSAFIQRSNRIEDGCQSWRAQLHSETGEDAPGGDH